MCTIHRTEEFDVWLSKLRDAKAKTRVVAHIRSAEMGNLGESSPSSDAVGNGIRGTRFMEEVKRKYLILLPDLPRWLETRDLLSSDESAIIENLSHDGFIVWNREYDMGSVVGQPDSAALIRAAREVSELLAFNENIAEVQDLLEHFDAEPATIFTAPSQMPSLARRHCRKIEFADARLLDHLPENLKGEITGVLKEDVPVVAAFEGQLPVAYAYVASETESLWDISIDTIESHRRKGYAAAAVVQLMSLMQERGKAAALFYTYLSHPKSIGGFNVMQ